MVKRPSAVEGAGGVGGAGAFGALASKEEEVVDITFSLPKPRVKEKAQKKKEKATVKAAIDAAEEAAEGGSEAAEAAVVVAAAVDEDVRDLEVLSTGSDPIDKISKEAADKEQTADATEKVVCSLVAAMVTAEEKNAKEIAVAAEKAAAIAAAATGEKAATIRDKTECQRKTKILLEMRAVQQDRKKTTEKAEDKAERVKKSLVESLW